MAKRPSDPKTVDSRAQTAERLRVAIARLGRTLRLTHVDDQLSPSQRDVLSTIARCGTLRLSELAASEGLNPTMLSRIVAKLDGAGLVTRTADPADARVVHVASTARGRSLHEEMKDERRDAILYAIARLSDDERRTLVEAMPVLETLVETLRSRTT